MTPSDIRLHLRLNRVCSLYDLTIRFNTDVNLIRDMLAIWINKGKVGCRMKTDDCGNQCTKCHPHMTELYEWQE